ncbi:MAG: hypothetical protein ACRCU9_05910, partial [Iodobacter sp.]
HQREPALALSNTAPRRHMSMMKAEQAVCRQVGVYHPGIMGDMDIRNSGQRPAERARLKAQDFQMIECAQGGYLMDSSKYRPSASFLWHWAQRIFCMPYYRTIVL